MGGHLKNKNILDKLIKSNVIFVTHLVWCGGKGWL